MAIQTINVSDSVFVLSKKLGIGARYDRLVFLHSMSEYRHRVYGYIFVNGQTFTTSFSYKITGVNFFGVREGNVGTITVSIRNVGSDGYPTGSDLCSGTIDGNQFMSVGEVSHYRSSGTFQPFNHLWDWVSFTTPYQLQKYTKYAIVFTSDTVGTPTDGFSTQSSANANFGDNDPRTKFYKYGDEVTIEGPGTVFNRTYRIGDVFFETWGIDGALNDPDPRSIYVNDTIMMLEPTLKIRSGLHTKYEPA